MNGKGRLIARMSGNFGVSFLSPLTGGGIANSIFPNCLSWEQTLVIALISAIIVTGLAISREGIFYGDKKRTTT